MSVGDQWTAEPSTASTEQSSSKPAEMAHAAASEASNVAGTAKSGAKDVAGEAATQAKAVASQAKEHVSQLVTQTKGELTTQAESKGQQAAEGLRTLSGQISALADGRPGEAGPLAGYLSDAQSKVSTLAERLEQGGPQGILDDVTSFARRRPGAFLIGAIGAGFVVGRLVRSGAMASSSDSSQSTPSVGSGSSFADYPAPALESGYPDVPLAGTTTEFGTAADGVGVGMLP